MLLANAPHNGCSRLQQVTLLRASGAKLHRKRALTVVARTGTPQPRLPLSTQTSASLRAAREQAVLQSLLFAGPDQLLLGVLAGSRLGNGKGAAAVLEAELGGGDCDSVREWLNEQSGSTAAKLQGSGWLRPSDVEFSPAARRVLSLAEAGAEAMGSSSVGTYHLLLVLMGAGGEQQAVQAGAEVASTEQVDGSGMAANSRGSTSGSEQPPRDSDLGLLRSLLDVAGVDRTALEVKLLALAEAGAEMPPAQDSQATAAGVVARAWHERDDNAFRQAHQNTAMATGPDPDDEYE